MSLPKLQKTRRWFTLKMGAGICCCWRTSLCRTIAGWLLCAVMQWPQPSSRWKVTAVLTWGVLPFWQGRTNESGTCYGWQREEVPLGISIVFFCYLEKALLGWILQALWSFSQQEYTICSGVACDLHFNDLLVLHGLTVQRFSVNIHLSYLYLFLWLRVWLPIFPCRMASADLAASHRCGSLSRAESYIQLFSKWSCAN